MSTPEEHNPETQHAISPEQAPQLLSHALAFDFADAHGNLSFWRQLPAEPAVFALSATDQRAEPYVGRTPNLRARLRRLLEPSDKHPRRLQLAGLVRTIQFQLVGSEFEGLLAQFNLLAHVYAAREREAEALKRMHLRPPSYLRFLGSNEFPRLTTTTRPSQRESFWAFGPFASNVAAERFAEETLKLFQLRRCVEDLEPAPDHPGCAYGEMKMCLAPCQLACTEERYKEESRTVEEFIRTRGESRLVQLRSARDAASAELEFEKAAALHEQIQRVESVAALAPELVRPLNELRVILLQIAPANPDAPAPEVNLFLFEGGTLRGPVSYSTLGMRLQNEQSGSSSLYAHPIMLAPVPEAGSATVEPSRASRDELTARFDEALTKLTPTNTDNKNAASASTSTTRQGHLALLKRWFYRPLTKREGEIFFPAPDGTWPTKSILRGIGRVAAKTALNN